MRFATVLSESEHFCLGVPALAQLREEDSVLEGLQLRQK